MDSTEDRQQLEITALKSIYAEDFIECPPPRAWKGAARTPEFIIRVAHPDLTHAAKISIHLNVKLPKTYPTLACPTFTIQKPIKGLTNEQVNKLSHAINNEAQKYKGSEMVFQIATFAQDWIVSNVSPPVEVKGSLALQMNQRAMDEERARREREAEEARKEQERAQREEEELNKQIRADALRQMVAKEQQNRMRRRANSESTEVPLSGDTPMESFGKEIVVNGVRFTTVKLFHARTEALGTVYMADPVCDDVNTTLPLELYVVTFDSQYYTTTQGRKKLKQLEQEIQEVTLIKHPNLISVFAVKLILPHSSGPPRLMILTERMPGLTLQDVLEDCASLKEERASGYLSQILGALNAIHLRDLVHRGITARCIGLASGDASSASKVIKLGNVGYHTRLLDLHRSNPFGSTSPVNGDDIQVPEAWLSNDEKNESSLLYTRRRDIHSVGIVFLQMLLGLDVMERYSDVHEALQSPNISPGLARIAMNMILPPKKNHVTCLTLLAELSDVSFRSSSGNINALASSTATLIPNPVTRSPPTHYQDARTPIPKTPMPHSSHFVGSPDEYFRMPPRTRASSRWKEDWEELELLGKGAFGSVVKARNKIDNRIYAVKKIRLRTQQSDTKIFREVNALSRLSHRFIVRYYTTWVETSEVPASTFTSDDSSTSGTEEGFSYGDGRTSVPDYDSGASERHLPTNGGFSIDMNDLDATEISGSRGSFPSIHFDRSASPGSNEETDSSGGSDDFDDLFSVDSARAIGGEVTGRQRSGTFTATTPMPNLTRTLYIQMEFVERQTLKELIEEGITEEESWRLFGQIVDALVHMSTLGILHRDIKLTNIFIDAKGDCKVGDFGLATSSLAAVDPSDVSRQYIYPEADMTLEVGTRLYIAPEVQSRKHGPRNHNKADMYSLGIVFFEMNYRFNTGAERIAVVEDLRKPGIFFPPTWDPHRTRQRQIITWLLQHDPNDRPTALELSQSPLLPPKLEDENFKGALNLMARQDSPYHQTVISSLFNQVPKVSRSFLYDSEADPPEHAALNDIVQERITSIFRLHGAVDMEPPLLMPVMDPEDQKNNATFIDRHGDLVALPSNLFLPFARLAARTGIKRIKRYHITNAYRPSPVAGHPKMTKAAIFDIISQDLSSGPVAAGAEVIAVINNILNSFPNLAQNYDIHVSHSQIIELALSRIPDQQRGAVVEIINQTKSSPSQKRALLLRKGLLRSTTDELEVLSEIDDDIENVLFRLERISPTLIAQMQPAINELQNTLQLAVSAGVTRPIFFHPLMLGSHQSLFKNGIIFAVVRKNKRMDVLAAGGRYDDLVARYSAQKQKMDRVCAVGLQIAMDKITATVASFQSTSVKTLLKEERSFGFWSPRRCDVYVISYHPGHLQDRLEIVSYLWQHNISADIMYESALANVEHENHLELCAREGILFALYPRPRTARRDQAAFKVKSILKGTEYELSRQELIGWLQQHIADQKRADLTTSAAPGLTESMPGTLLTKAAKDIALATDTQVVLPIDTKKQRKVKQLFLDRAFETATQVRSSVQGGMPTLAVDVPPDVFDAMIRSSKWITDEEAWKALAALFPPQTSAYAQQVREAAVKRKTEGHLFALLYAVREERIQLLNLSA